MLRKLLRWGPLDEADQRAVLALPHKLRRFAKASYVVREDGKPTHAAVLLSGFVCRQKCISNGSRQIIAVHMPGDIVDLQNSFLEHADHSVQTFTEAELAMIPAEALKELAFGRPAIGLALWQDTLVDGSIQREWTTNVGRRNARERTSHLLCEWGYRVEAAGLAQRTRYQLPMTQEEMADALGLTPVHMNRMLMSLDREGLTSRRRNAMVINDWTALATLGDFQPGYLHLPELEDISSQALQIGQRAG
jgi:CRP-like cAMP-binding protein